MFIEKNKEGGSVAAKLGRLSAALLLPAFIMVSAIRPCLAGGLSTAFSKVTIENLESGRSYNIEDLGSVPLEINNTSDRKVQLQIDVVLPKEEELTDGYIPVPDKDWIALTESYFEIEPGKSARTSLYIDIPEGREYRGKKYCVFIWSHTIGETIGVGLKSKLLFTTVKEGQ